MVRSLVFSFTLLFTAKAQQHQPTPLPLRQTAEDPAAVQRGRALFRSSCGFCHGNDATGSRAPDLLRSTLVLHDDHGNILGPFIRNGRPDKGMPSFSTMKDDEVADIVAFLHRQADQALHSAHVPGDYPLSKLLTGNAAAGKAYFNDPGGCSECHSPTGDLAGIAKRFSPIDLQQEMVYPGNKKAIRTGSVTLQNGERFEGKVANEDEFNVSLICQDGWYRSWPRSQVTVEIHDPLEKHRELMKQYSEADIHNLFVYLETLK